MKTKLRKILYPLLAAIAVLALVGSGALHRLDRWVQDWMYQQGGVPSADIVLIGIDEETLSELGPYGPNYRSVMAFARTGDPGTSLLPAWPACTPEEEHTMVLDENSRCLTNFDHDLIPAAYKIISPVFGRIMADMSGQAQH